MVAGGQRGADLGRLYKALLAGVGGWPPTVNTTSFLATGLQGGAGPNLQPPPGCTLPLPLAFFLLREGRACPGQGPCLSHPRTRPQTASPPAQRGGEARERRPHSPDSLTPSVFEPRLRAPPSAPLCSVREPC